MAETKEEGGRFYASGSALKRSVANDMNLDPESEGIVMRAARLAPDALRDGFFSDVARRLKYLRNITPQDVRYACSAALGELKQQEHRRAG